MAAADHGEDSRPLGGEDPRPLGGGPRPTRCDVVVIGAGHQGLVAAVTLAEAGLEVVALEAQETAGGATRSAEVTVPGLEHDLFATNMNLFLGSPFFAAHGDELAAAGLAFAGSDAPYASAFPGGRSLRVTTDTAQVERMWAEHDAADAEGWQRLRQLFDDVSAAYLPLSSNPVPSRGTLAALRAGLRRDRSTTRSELAQALASSTRAFGERYLHTPEARSLAAAWGMHLDYAPDIAGGAIFPLLELFLDQQHGMSVVAGGASRLPEALTTLLAARGGEVRTGSAAERVSLDAHGVARVHTAGGVLEPRVGVVSTATLPALAGLLGAGAPAEMQDAARRFRFGPGTFMLHLAVEGGVPWQDERLADFAYVHLGPYVDDMARTYQQALAGLLPDEPLLVVGQSGRVDPGRRVGDVEAVWVQVRALPGAIAGDAAPGQAGGDLTGAGWDDAREPVAARVLAKLERFAPGLGARVRGQAAMTPADLERHDANLVGGDSASGSHHLDQLVGLRPSAALSRYRTPVPGLYLAGAGTWPGAGVNAVSGQRAAEAVLRDHTRGGAGRAAGRGRRAGRRHR